MNRLSTSINTYSDLNHLRALQDEEIDLSEIPEATPEQMSPAMLRIGGKQVERKKVRVNMYLDADLIAIYKAQAGGRGYQTLINEALRANIRNQELESTLRRIIREEIIGTA